jgi:hypothetical protein
MDALHQEVAALVEQAQVARQDPVTTFFQIKSLALTACGQEVCACDEHEQYGTRKVLPHLSESWFC